MDRIKHFFELYKSTTDMDSRLTLLRLCKSMCLECGFESLAGDFIALIEREKVTINKRNRKNGDPPLVIATYPNSPYFEPNWIENR